MASGWYDVIRKALGWLSSVPEVLDAAAETAALVRRAKLAANVTNEMPLYALRRRASIAANIDNSVILYGLVKKQTPADVSEGSVN